MKAKEDLRPPSDLNNQAWVLGTKLSFSGREVHGVNEEAISLFPLNMITFICLELISLTTLADQESTREPCVSTCPPQGLRAMSST